MTTRPPSVEGELDPGAYIGHEPEREAESIPGGTQPGDQRVAAYGSRPGVKGEPDEATHEVSPDHAGGHGDGSSNPADGDASDVVEGPVGSASLKGPAEAAPFAADLDALPDHTERARHEAPDAPSS
jgi:hypothetical protein